MRARAVLDGAPDSLGHQQALVLGQHLRDPSRGLRSQPQVVRSFVRRSPTLLKGLDAAEEEHPDRITCKAGLLAQHLHDPRDGELSMPAAHVVRDATRRRWVHGLQQLIHLTGGRVEHIAGPAHFSWHYRPLTCAV